MSLLPHRDGESAVRAFPRSFFFGRLVPSMVLLALGAALAVWLIGSRNPYTPAGYVG